jgi:hypothetical protein
MSFLLLSAFGIPASIFALVFIGMVIVHGVRRQPRSMVYLGVSIPFAAGAVLLQVAVSGGIGRTKDTLLAMALSSSPLFWLVAATIEAVLAPTPYRPDEKPPRPSAVRVTLAVVLPLLALALYGMLLNLMIKPHY